MNRRNFLTTLGLGAAGIILPGVSQAKVLQEAIQNPNIKPISGSWFEFQHPGGKEGVYWDKDLRNFTATQWREKIREIRETGMEYLVMMNVASHGFAFYDTDLAPKFKMGCEDPIETVLSAADEFGVKFFVSNDYWALDLDAVKMMTDKELGRKKAKCMEEIYARYGHHKSFYGWYFPNESWLDPYFGEYVIPYVNECAQIAKSLNANCVNIIAPYNIKAEKCDDTFIKQLEQLNVEIVAYQDGVGVGVTTFSQSARAFENLAKAHQKAGRSRIWADMELFYFEQTTHGSLISADFDKRIIHQMEAISPFVDKILVYQYLGIMNKPGSLAHAGLRDESVRLYNQYMDWYRKQNFK